MSKPTDLYRFFDSSNELIYVGISYDCDKRMNQHYYGSDWWPLYSTLEVKSFKTREEAQKAESKAIKEELPKFNIAGADASHVLKNNRLRPSFNMKESELNKKMVANHLETMDKKESCQGDKVEWLVNDINHEDIVIDRGVTTMRGLFIPQVKAEIINSLGGSHFDEYSSCFILKGKLFSISLSKTFGISRNGSSSGEVK